MSTVSDAVLVINCGSSSIKFALYEHAAQTTPEVSGLAEQLNSDDASLTLKGSLNEQRALGHADHALALDAILSALSPWKDRIKGIGHRIVHGGEQFSDSCIINASNLAELEHVSPLAPLHNPVNVLGLTLCQRLMPSIPNVAVFDTAFHQTLPETAYLYAVPYEWYEQHGVRRYGFHGTSYRYVSQEAASRLGKPLHGSNLLIAHLGNGCSACAIRAGQSVDTSMGLTPLEGLPMGTRSGDVDPGLIEHLNRATGQSLNELMAQLNRNSGLLGLSGISNDMRQLLEAQACGSAEAKRAIDVFCYRIARQLAALSTSLPTLDAVVFTGGIGEHASAIRAGIIDAWQALGVSLDPALNQSHGDEQGHISAADAPARVLVVPTDEERMIAQDTYRLIQQAS